MIRFESDGLIQTFRIGRTAVVPQTTLTVIEIYFMFRIFMFI